MISRTPPGASHVCSLVALVLALGCGLSRASPRDVAGAFWDAIQDRNSDAAQALCTAPDISRVEGFIRARSVVSITLGEELKNAHTAVVETSVASAERAAPLVFNTHLSRIDDAWKVDLRSTLREMRRAALEISMQEIDDVLQQGMQIVGEALEQGAREAANALSEALEELQRELGELP